MGSYWALPEAKGQGDVDPFRANYAVRTNHNHPVLGTNYLSSATLTGLFKIRAADTMVERFRGTPAVVIRTHHTHTKNYLFQYFHQAYSSLVLITGFLKSMMKQCGTGPRSLLLLKQCGTGPISAAAAAAAAAAADVQVVSTTVLTLRAFTRVGILSTMK